jgi:integrase
VQQKRVKQVSKKSSKERAGRVVRYTRADGTVVEKHYAPYDPTRSAQRNTVHARETVGALIASYEMSPQYLALAEVSKQAKARAFQDLLHMQHVAAREVAHVNLIDLRNAINKARGPGAAADFGTHVAALFNWAEEEGRIPSSPARRMLKGLKRGEIATWKDTHYQQVITHNGLPERLRRAIVLARWTAQRRGDLCKMLWSDIYTDSEGFDWIHVEQEKTGEEVDLPIGPELAAELKMWRAEVRVFDRAGIPQGTILTETNGDQWNPTNLSVQLHNYLAQIPRLPRNLSLHGLRKFAMTWAAEHGATQHELSAISGHRTLAMVQHYTRHADRIQSARSYRKKLSG